MKSSRAFLEKQNFDFQYAHDFLILVYNFLDMLPNERDSLLNVISITKDNPYRYYHSLIPELYFPFVSMVVTKICRCARALDRQNPSDSDLLQSLRDVYPRRLLVLLHRTVLVQNQFMAHSERIQDSVDSLIFLLQQTNRLLDMLLLINPLNYSTRETLDSDSDLSKLFSFTLKTVYFTAGYGSVLLNV